MDYSPPGSSVHGISQGRILEWVALSSSKRSSRPRNLPCVSCVGRQILYHWATRESQLPLWRPYSQIKWHSEIPGVRPSTCPFGGGHSSTLCPSARASHNEGKKALGKCVHSFRNSRCYFVLLTVRRGNVVQGLRARLWNQTTWTWMVALPLCDFG